MANTTTTTPTPEIPNLLDLSNGNSISYQKITYNNESRLGNNTSNLNGITSTKGKKYCYLI